MSGKDLASFSDADKLKLTVFHAVSKTCDDVGNDNTFLGNFTVNHEAKELITELIWKKMQLYSEDLEAFAQHAKRNNINTDDVKLLFRRNHKLLEVFSKMDEEEANEKEKSGKRKRNIMEQEEESMD